MNLTTENILLIGSILLFISILAGKTSYRFGVPTLLFFLAIGMLAGSDGIGKIQFDDPKLAQFIGIVALNFILFSGGLDTNWESVRPVLWKGLSLSTLGVLITALSVGLFVWQILDFTLLEGILLGAIVSSTDAAAVFSILRSKNLALKYHIRPILELESGSNDPMAYFLTIAFTSLVSSPESRWWEIIPFFFQQIILGAALGIGFGKLGKWIINSIKLDFDGLYPVLMITIMFFTFSATDFVGGNGFLSVYLAAVYMGNHEFVHKKTILKFFDGLAWLMQIVLFLTLGLLVYPSHVVPVIGVSLLVSVFMILIARPLSIFISLSFFKMKARSRWFISWVGLRGAVPIVFATYPLLAGIEKAEMIFNLVFFISVTSVLLQGTTLSVMSKWLRVIMPGKAKRKTSLDIALSDNIKSELIEITLPEHSPAIGQKILEVGFPPTTLIVMIQREGKYLTPNGSTVLQRKDKLLTISDSAEGLNQVHRLLGIT